MNAKRSSLLMLAATLLLGLAVGSSVENWWLASPAQAHALDRSELERLYSDLNASSRPLVEGSNFLAKVAKLATPSVVHIQSRHAGSRGGSVEETGSGVITTSRRMPGYFIVTNRHVVTEARRENISIHLQDGRVLRPTRTWEDKHTDVAVLQVNADDLQPARWGNSDEVEIGHMVLAMGSPFGLSQSVTYGIISAKGRRSLKLGPRSDMLNQDFLQTDAAINPGNSGGPLIDLRGQIIGINTAIASNGGGNEGIGFSIPSNLVQRVVDSLLAHGRVQRAYLGVKLDPSFNSGTAHRLKLDRLRGARVLEVYENTPAARARLRLDDVILKFGDVEVQDENHFINLVSLTPVNRTVRLTVFRNGSQVVIDVVLDDRSKLQQRTEAPAPANRGTRVVPMGLTLLQLDEDVAGQLGLQEQADGLLVLQVDSTATLFGDVQLYDLIEEAARTPVRTVDELQQVLQQHRDDDSLVLKVRRRTNAGDESRLVIWRRSQNVATPRGV